MRPQNTPCDGEGNWWGKRGSETASVLPLRRFHDPKVAVTTRAGRGRVATSCQAGTAVVPTPATNSARHLLRHQSGKTGYFPVETWKPSCPTRGALALFEGGRKSPHQAAGSRKSFCGLFF